MSGSRRPLPGQAAPSLDTRASLTVLGRPKVRSWPPARRTCLATSGWAPAHASCLVLDSFLLRGPSASPAQLLLHLPPETPRDLGFGGFSPPFLFVSQMLDTQERGMDLPVTCHL